MDTTDEDIASAERRAQELLERLPVITSVRYNDAHAQVRFHLSDGTELSFVKSRLKGLEHATSSDVAMFEISPSGLGVHFPTLDADLYLPSLLMDKGVSA